MCGVNNKFINKVEFLNGFLNGLSIIDGSINQFFSRLFFLELKGAINISDINHFFAPHIVYEIKKEIHIDSCWEKEFEMGIRECILYSPVGLVDSTAILNRKRYISFKIMDMINFIELHKYGDISLHIIEAESESEYSKFFILSTENVHLVFLFSQNQL